MFPIEVWAIVIGHLSLSERKRLLYLSADFAYLIGRWKNVTLRIASFDIGKNNFAQYVEDCSLDKLIELEGKYAQLEKSLKRRTKGPMNDSVNEILDKTFLSGKRVDLGVFNFQVGQAEGSKKLDNPTRLNFLKHMKRFTHLWKTCDIFLIEQQYVNTFVRGGGINVDALKLGEGLHMWLLDRFPHKSVVSFGSQYKTQILGAPEKLKKPQRKAWAVGKSKNIFQLRADTQIVQIYDLIIKIKRKRINTEEKIQSYLIEFEGYDEDVVYMANRIVRDRQKLDDISDVVVQLQAYKYRKFVACF